MSWNRVKIKDRLREFGRDKFKINGEFLFCIICNTPVDYKRKCTIVSHLKSKKHIDKERRMSPAKGNRNLSSENVNIVSFASDVIKAFNAANIPVEKVNHPSLISVFQKYLGFESADMFPLNISENQDVCNLKELNIQQSAYKTPEKLVTNENAKSKVNSKQFNESSVNSSCPRKDFIPWSDYFMSVAFLSAKRSKDPNSQVGACIVNKENKIVGTGYNGMPLGCSDDDLPWTREADNILDTKYPYVCHAEMNAICNKNSADVKGCAIYVALFPCNECAKLIIQSGIKEVIFMCDKYHDTPYMTASRHLLDLAGVKYRQHIPKNSKILIDFDSIKNSSVN